MHMEVQCPFQITLQRAGSDEFADYFFDRFAKYGCSLALIDAETGKQWHYSELRVWTENCVQRLREIGVDRGTRCALICSTTAQAIFVHIACVMLDAIIVSINANLSAGEIWAQVDNSRATYCFTEQQYMSKVEDVKRIGTIRTGGRISSIRLLDEILGSVKLTRKLLKKRDSAASFSHPEIASKSKNKQSLHAVSCFDLSADEQNHQDENSNLPPNSAPASPPRQTVIMFYSIGQSKFPKPAEVTHRSLLYNLQQLSCPIFGPPTAGDKCLLAANFHHVFGLATAFLALKNGAQLIVTPKQNPNQIISIIKNWNVTMAYVNPTLILKFSKDAELEKNKLESLRSIVTSGAPIGEAIMQLCKKRLKLNDLRQAYSVTEAGGICSLAPYGQERLKSVGVPLPGLHFKVVDWEMKETCMPGQLGQILIEGPPVEIPVNENPKQVQKVFEAGYFKTGDVGYYDETGYIFVHNKIKDVVKCKGVLLCPSEVESILHGHPGIEDCAVVGRQEQLIGTETPAAFVVKNPRYQQLASNEIRQYVGGKIPHFKELRGGVYFVPEIPRSACGKILRRQLKQTWDHVRATYRSVPNNANASSENKPAAAASTNTSNKTPNSTNKTSSSSTVPAATINRKTVNDTKAGNLNKINRAKSIDKKNVK